MNFAWSAILNWILIRATPMHHVTCGTCGSDEQPFMCGSCGENGCGRCCDDVCANCSAHVHEKCRPDGKTCQKCINASGYRKCTVCDTYGLANDCAGCDGTVCQKCSVACPKCHKPCHPDCKYKCPC